MTTAEQRPVKVAILDDYQGVAQTFANWQSLPQGSELRVFEHHLADEARLAERLQPFEIIVAMRERTPFPRSLLDIHAYLKGASLRLLEP
jgi:hypothetical protein